MSAWLLLPHKNANAGLSISHSQYIMPPHFITIKGLTCPGCVKWWVGRVDDMWLNCPSPSAWITSLVLLQVVLLIIQGGRGTDWDNTPGPETNLKPLGRPAVDLHNSICSIRSTGKHSLSHLLILYVLLVTRTVFNFSLVWPRWKFYTLGKMLKLL